jgi:hypothetical protein
LGEAQRPVVVTIILPIYFALREKNAVHGRI